VPIPLALAHQAVALVVLTLAVMQAARLAARPATAAFPEAALPIGQPG
jgi:cytochrome c oxidase assembly protein subunit 15